MEQLLNELRKYYHQQNTKAYDFRVRSLLRLKLALKKYESELIESLYKDLGKSEFESYETEIGLLYKEIDETTRHLKQWMKTKRVKTPLMLQPARSYVIREPLGVVLIMSPWNYPLQLTIAPLIASIAAGNCALIKPSSYSKHTSLIIKKMIDETFEPCYIACVEGGRSVNEEILKLNFDHIFFTGSVNVGKVVMRAASEHLTPMTLELGGKSPCIVDKSVHLKTAAKRIIWGKCLNAGQTCISVDTIYVHESKKAALIEALKQAIDELFPMGCLQSDEFGKIINDRHFLRLCSYLKEGNILHGGQVDIMKNKIELTLIDQLDEEALLLNEEIFGPILPIVTWSDEADLFVKLHKNENPLACYIFSNNKRFQRTILRGFAFGGGCINTTILHVSNSNLGFGGIKQSGMGQYHGYRGFSTLTHEKSILVKGRYEMNVQYPPYKKKVKILKLFMK